MQDAEQTPGPESTFTNTTQPTHEAPAMMKDLRDTTRDNETTTSDSTHEKPAAARDTRKRATGARRFIIIMFMMSLSAAAATAQMVSLTVSPTQISKKIVQVTGEL